MLQFSRGRKTCIPRHKTRWCSDMTADLHLHTYYSDGSWSPADLIERAVELKIRCIAITDHDTMAGVREAQHAAAGRLDIIPGVEINTVWTGEDGRRQSIHILGYFPDEDNQRLVEALQRQQDARMKLVHDTIFKLSTLGVHITVESVQECAGLGSIGRPHLSRAIVNAGGAADVTEAYERFFERSSPDYIERESLSPVEAIKAVIAAGGIASIAHPGKTEGIKEIILELGRSGLKAVEAYHRSHSLKEVRGYIRFANRNGFAITGGSDCHGPQGEHPASIGSVSVPLEVADELRRLHLQMPV